jgi:hypothetical protein
MLRGGRKYNHQIDFGIGDHFVHLREGIRNPKPLGNLLGVLPATAGDGHDLKVRQKLENGNVAITAPIPHAHDCGPDLFIAVRAHQISRVSI